ncbi:Nucleic acid-binding, OB-fold [Lasallia pustulata]|uniref:Ribosomal RNA-processing protein 40 n=1 Tax=Lasallia pustulata TaxID=136370 RepID=A0A1W5CUT6_9LECA|nr:Nucleic acid-binding, OB-fold [Lasallia pustulata]
MAAQTLVLPGEELSTELLPTPSNPSIPLKLGPGLRHTPPATITPTLAGTLCIDHRKNAIWVENNGSRYIPQTSDLVLATVHHSSTDYYHCLISPQTPFALLPQLAFEGATKKSRPQLVSGSLIYARISSASKHLEPELVCYNPSTGKSEGMGELKEGMVFDISLGMARRLLMGRQKEDGGMVVLEEIADKVAFEVAVGRNGRIWVHSGSVKETLLVGRAVQETDREGLGLEEQRKLVRRLLKGL